MSGVAEEHSGQASRAVYALRQALAGVGFEPTVDLPGLSIVRFEGQTMVLLGRVTPQVAARLAHVIASMAGGGAP
jgi:hypothetical protein